LYSASVTETVDLLLRGARLPDRQSLADIAITGDRIVAVDPVARPAHETIELGGRLVTPGLVESHIHLDKALLTDRVSTTAGTLEEAIRLTGQAKRTFTAEDITARARQVLDMAVRAGTTAMRSHVEVDPIVGLTGMEAMLALREEYAPALDLQLCAFAQEGIVKAPGTEKLLRRALQMGADLVGGCPYNDTDGVEHIRVVFALATAFGVDADFHVDFADEPQHLHVREVAEQTVRAGWQGRVVVGHLSELAAVPHFRQDEIIADIVDLGAGRVGPLAVRDAAQRHLGDERRENRQTGALPPFENAERQVRRQEDRGDEQWRQEAVVEPEPLLPFRHRPRGGDARQLRHAGSFTRCT
jgi:cytosine deaminase